MNILDGETTEVPVTEQPARADLQRLKSRGRWSAETATDSTITDSTAARRAECRAARAGHLDVVLLPGDTPRCDHCGEALSPDALRRAGIRGLRP